MTTATLEDVIPQIADDSDAFGFSADEPEPETDDDVSNFDPNEQLSFALADQGVEFSAEQIAAWDPDQQAEARRWCFKTDAWLKADAVGQAVGDPPAKPAFLAADGIKAAADIAAEQPTAEQQPADQPSPTESAAVESTVQPAPRDPVADLTLAIEGANAEIVRLSMIEAELKDRLKGIKKALEAAVSDRMELQRAVSSHERDAARGQKTLPFGQAAAEGAGAVASPASSSPEAVADRPATTPTTDPGKTTPVADLNITKGQAEKLEESEVKTVADLEAFMSAGKLQYVKGFGDKAIDRISDALFDWRQSNPIPVSEDEGEK